MPRPLNEYRVVHILGLFVNGQTRRETARIMGLHVNTVSRCVNSREFRERLRECLWDLLRKNGCIPWSVSPAAIKLAGWKGHPLAHVGDLVRRYEADRKLMERLVRYERAYARRLEGRIEEPAQAGWR